MGGLTILVALLVPIMVLALLARARPLFDIAPPGRLLLASEWRPLKQMFGFLPFIAGTLWVTLIAMLLATPLSLLCAIYLAEYAPGRLRELIRPPLDLLAGIPSVVYGLWGVLTVVPSFEKWLHPGPAKLSGVSPSCAAITRPATRCWPVGSCLV